MARRDEHNRTADGIVSAMLLYNFTAVLVLAFVVVLHALMAV